MKEAAMDYGKKEFQAAIDYEFKNRDLLRDALTHSSYAGRPEGWPHNERLEFLGDAVLETAVSDWLYAIEPPLSEGHMTKFRAQGVCEAALAACAKKLRIGELLYLGRGEILTGGRERPSLIADAFEAVIGAIYLDGGFGEAQRFVRAQVIGEMEKMLSRGFTDAKTHLQELLQKTGTQAPTYRLVGRSGPDHQPVFTSAVMLPDGREVSGSGQSKKEAEQAAAQAALDTLREESSKELSDEE